MKTIDRIQSPVRYDEDIRAMKRLIKFYTAKREWAFVAALFRDLGELEEKKEQAHAGS